MLKGIKVLKTEITASLWASSKKEFSTFLLKNIHFYD